MTDSATPRHRGIFEILADIRTTMERLNELSEELRAIVVDSSLEEQTNDVPIEKFWALAKMRVPAFGRDRNFTCITIVLDREFQLRTGQTAYKIRTVGDLRLLFTKMGSPAGRDWTNAGHWRDIQGLGRGLYTDLRMVAELL